MRMWMLAAGAAALAITAPAAADPKSGGQGGGKGNSAQVQRGGGGQGHSMKAAKADRGGGKAVRVAQADRGDRGKGRDLKAARVREVKGNRIREVRADKVRDNRVVGLDGKGDRLALRTRDFDNDGIIVRRAFDRDLFPGRGGGLIAGCPPGLDKKDNGCLPPGQAKKLLGVPLATTAFTRSLVPRTFRTWFRDDDDFLFRSGDGFIYRVDRDNGLIDGLIPMTGAGYYALGDPWPSPYNFYNVPYQYRSMYADSRNDCYRYAYGAIYRVDCDRGVVNSIVSLLAGDLGVGSPLPMGYDVYNVPLGYRAQYYDTPTNWYRYNDGYIYQVDPTTRLITAVINALT